MTFEVFCELYDDFAVSHPYYLRDQLVSHIVSVLSYSYHVLILYSSYMYVR